MVILKLGYFLLVRIILRMQPSKLFPLRQFIYWCRIYSSRCVHSAECVLINLICIIFFNRIRGCRLLSIIKRLGRKLLLFTRYVFFINLTLIIMRPICITHVTTFIIRCHLTFIYNSTTVLPWMRTDYLEIVDLLWFCFSWIHLNNFIFNVNITYK
jgi:hypothetical protein